ncbi:MULTISPECIES: glycoside hydrolase family 27 protein [unclassified Pseudoxanthomonas]|uniref:glycoside hydrolase family 27 protein n=1 Tax=unclassified Pseudoxanthomonas TaxID=2645906 RepID=UPI003078A26E
MRQSRFLRFLRVQLLAGSLLLAAATSNAAPPSRDFHQWAPTPPLGWNSWDAFGTTVTEAQIKQQADFMAAKLKAHGWQYITVDIQWYQPTAKGHIYEEGAVLAMDGFSRLVPAPEKFPSAAGGQGFKPLADYVHSKGLKFGIHMMRGIPRQAVKQNTPLLGTHLRAADIADINSICSWNPDMYGVDMSKPGAQAYYDSLMQQLADWGVDFVKVDDLSRPYQEHQAEIEAIRKAIDKTGRPIVFSTSPGETPLSAGNHVNQHANMWRISDDFWDRWELLLAQFKRLHEWTPYRIAGAWPDADMLPLGIVEFDRPTRFTRDEQITLMTLWSIARSPLIHGGDLTRTDPFTLSLLTNDEVLAVNQRSAHNRQLFRSDDGLIAWVADAADGKGKYLAVFDTRDASGATTGTRPVPVEIAALGLQGQVQVRDLWSRTQLEPVSGTFKPQVVPHGARLFLLTPSTASSASKP